MAAPRIRHLIFDLGGTLMHAGGDWESIRHRADETLVKELKRHNITLDSRVFRNRLHEYYAERDQNHQETTYHFVLSELLNEMGYTDIAEAVLRSALDALFAITQSNWILEDDTLATLEQLRQREFRLGILSNAGDDRDVQQLIERFGLSSKFDFVLTSAKCYYRKPHPRAFELALTHWSIPPQEAVMIGDSLEADILGAQNLKMHTIWISRRANFTEMEIQRVKPDYTVRSLSEVLPALDKMSPQPI